MISLDELQTRQKTWSAHNFPGSGISNGTNTLLGIIEEAGELAHAHLKGLQSIRHTPEEILAMKVDALGDILVYMADYANRHDLRLQEVIDQVWPEVESRDWIKYPVDGRTK